MERYINANRLVNRLTDNEALKTYYTLLLMAENEEAKTLIDKQFWLKFEELNAEDKTQIRLAFQQAERNLLKETKLLHQEVDEYKASVRNLGKAA
jgi:hypothetical protein